MLIEKLKEMFEKVVLRKDASLIPIYYHEDFLLYTNGKVTNYAKFLESHQKIYQTPIQYQIEYDDPTIFENENRLAGRIWITILLPNQTPKKIEVILIMEFREEKIYRLWELTYPDWSKLSEFNEMNL